MYIVMLGGPGSGKGSASKILTNQLNIPHISTGDMFREQIKKQTDLGKLADSYISKGQLVPDEVTIQVVKDRLSWEDAKNGVILDGFPRTVVQADKLKEILANKGEKVDITINLVTPEEELIERIVNRRVCSNQECKAVYNLVLHPPKVEGKCDKCGSELITRKDDNVETVKSRLEQYFTATSPLVEYYEKEGVLYTETVSQSINKLGEVVAKEILEHLKEI